MKWERLAHRQVLEKPRSQDVCGHFGENPSLLVVPPFSVGLVFLAGAGGGHGAVQAVTLAGSFYTSFSSDLVHVSNSAVCARTCVAAVVRRAERGQAAGARRSQGSRGTFIWLSQP